MSNISENSEVFHIFQKILVASTILALLTMSRRASGCVREQGRSSSPLQGQGQGAQCSTSRSQVVVTRSNVLCCATATTSVTSPAQEIYTLYVRCHEQKCEWFALSEELVTSLIIWFWKDISSTLSITKRTLFKQFIMKIFTLASID